MINMANKFSNKDSEIAALILAAIRAGYKVTFEGKDLGTAAGGSHFHVSYLDEVVEEFKDINLWDYINKGLNK